MRKTGGGEGWGGNSFWPKPILHPSVEENFDRLVYIQIKPFGFVLGVFIAMI
jgi:hypothetical protein